MRVKKKRPGRARVEIRHRDLNLSLDIADDLIATATGGIVSLIERLRPATPIQAADPVASEIEVDDDEVAVMIDPEHGEDPSGDDAHHARLREQFTALFHSVCDVTLEDVLQIARAEQSRRSVGGN